jgi:DNA helicase INO80
MANFVNRNLSERELNSVKRKRRYNNSEGEEEDRHFRARITEDKYRSMLGEHIQKYKRRYKDPLPSPAPPPPPPPPRMGIPIPKSSLGGSKTRKLGSEQRGGLHDMETTSEWANDITPSKHRDYHEPEFTPKYVLAL